jgi:hypothetical protein
MSQICSMDRYMDLLAIGGGVAALVLGAAIGWLFARSRFTRTIAELNTSLVLERRVNKQLSEAIQLDAAPTGVRRRPRRCRMNPCVNRRCCRASAPKAAAIGGLFDIRRTTGRSPRRCVGANADDVFISPFRKFAMPFSSPLDVCFVPFGDMSGVRNRPLRGMRQLSTRLVPLRLFTVRTT